jgi:hypothetical protein
MEPEDAARFQQEQVDDLVLGPGVAAATRAAFERLRRVHAQDILLYDLYTLVADKGYLMRERALRDRFIQWCGGSLMFDDAAGQAPPRTEHVDLLQRHAQRSLRVCPHRGLPARAAGTCWLRSPSAAAFVRHFGQQTEVDGLGNVHEKCGSDRDSVNDLRLHV